MKIKKSAEALLAIAVMSVVTVIIVCLIVPPILGAIFL
jgi:hypothetical protein